MIEQQEAEKEIQDYVESYFFNVQEEQNRNLKSCTVVIYGFKNRYRGDSDYISVFYVSLLYTWESEQ